MSCLVGFVYVIVQVSIEESRRLVGAREVGAACGQIYTGVEQIIAYSL